MYPIASYQCHKLIRRQSRGICETLGDLVLPSYSNLAFSSEEFNLSILSYSSDRSADEKIRVQLIHTIQTRSGCARDKTDAFHYSRGDLTLQWFNHQCIGHNASSLYRRGYAEGTANLQCIFRFPLPVVPTIETFRRREHHRSCSPSY